MLRRHVHKKITKWRYRVENPRRFVFGKSILFTLGSGLTTPYSPGPFVSNFYQTFNIMFIEFWLKFEHQIRPTRFAINVLFITVRVERKVRLCVNLFDFFLGEYSFVWREICRVLSHIKSKFLRGISTKSYFMRIFQKFCANQGYPLPKFVKIQPTFWKKNSETTLCWKFSRKIHKSTLICCLHLAKEACPYKKSQKEDIE